MGRNEVSSKMFTMEFIEKVYSSLIPVIHIIVSTVFFYIAIEKAVYRWLFAVVYIAAMLLAERKRIGVLIPVLSTKFRFFR